MTTRENILRAVRFESPDSIPMYFHINDSCWQHYPQDELQELMLAHPYLFPDYQRVEKVTPDFRGNALAGTPYTDEWGCVWETTENGIVGAVTGHPLDDWAKLAQYTPPDADLFANWQLLATQYATQRANGELIRGSLEHGHTFLRACDIHGYENVLYDLMDEEPAIQQLLAMIESYNVAVVQHYIDLGVEWMSYPEDLGMQVGPMISPSLFTQYFRPIYQRMIAPARAAGCVIHMHSDGDLHELIDDLTEGGVEVINLQDLVNGIDWIQEKLVGRVCVDLDIDRQEITRFGTPAEIDKLIREEVTRLSTPQGGLMMIYGLYPGVPIDNVKALMDAMERYAGFYA